MHHTRKSQYLLCCIYQFLAEKQHNNVLIKFIVQTSKYKTEISKILKSYVSKDIRIGPR